MVRGRAHPLKNNNTVEGHVTLRCELSKAGVSVEWWRDAQLLKDGEKYQMKQEGRVVELVIRDLTLADAGEYCCSVGVGFASAVHNIQTTQQGIKAELSNFFTLINPSHGPCKSNTSV
uniref:Ig-like domain-containing protein n=1 Tax=Gouania willdenowi TaxID=441366 RepID=A0A8C5IAU6_GOUWI